MSTRSDSIPQSVANRQNATWHSRSGRAAAPSTRSEADSQAGLPHLIEPTANGISVASDNPFSDRCLLTPSDQRQDLAAEKGHFLQIGPAQEEELQTPIRLYSRIPSAISSGEPTGAIAGTPR